MTLTQLIGRLERIQRELGPDSGELLVCIHEKGSKEGIFCRKPVKSVGVGKSTRRVSAQPLECYRPYSPEREDKLPYQETINITY